MEEDTDLSFVLDEIPMLQEEILCSIASSSCLSTGLGFSLVELVETLDEVEMEGAPGSTPVGPSCTELTVSPVPETSLAASTPAVNTVMQVMQVAAPCEEGTSPGSGFNLSDALVQEYLKHRPGTARRALMEHGDFVVPASSLPVKTSGTGDGEYQVGARGRFTVERPGKMLEPAISDPRHIKLSATVQRRCEYLMMEQGLSSKLLGTVVDALLRKHFALMDAFEALQETAGVSLVNTDSRFLVPLRSTNSAVEGGVEWLPLFVRRVPGLDDSVTSTKSRGLSKHLLGRLSDESALKLGLREVRFLALHCYGFHFLLFLFNHCSTFCLTFMKLTCRSH